MTISSRISRRSVLAGGLTVFGALCTGCLPVPQDPVRVVAVTAATAQQARPVLGVEGMAAVRRAAESDRGSFTLIVAGAPELTGTIDLVARRDRGGSDEVEYGPRRAELLDGLVARVAALVGAVEPRHGEPDLLGALAEAARGTPGALLVLDSGVTTTDPVDLRRLGWDGDPAAIVEHLRSEDTVPDLRGWEVVLVGLGRVAGDQAAPGTPQLRWLERFWAAVCAAGGARSCRSEAVLDAPAPPSAATRRTAVVPIPDVGTVELAGGVIESTIPDSRLGFAPGSAELAPDAAQALAPIVAAYRRAPGSVQVAGYVAFWGEESYRASLSRARADAVGRLLLTLGVAPGDLTTTGLGAADGPEASTTGGRFDESKVVANGIRRVVVTLTPAH